MRRAALWLLTPMPEVSLVLLSFAVGVRFSEPSMR